MNSESKLDRHRKFLAMVGFDLRCEPANFSNDEIGLLRRYGNWLEALASGKLGPVTQEQEHFVAVANGQFAPMTIYEKAWLKLLAVRNRQDDRSIGNLTEAGDEIRPEVHCNSERQHG